MTLENRRVLRMTDRDGDGMDLRGTLKGIRIRTRPRAACLLGTEQRKVRLEAVRDVDDVRDRGRDGLAARDVHDARHVLLQLADDARVHCSRAQTNR